MNGAESLVGTLVAGGVEVCFSNPGTSEMHFLAALDKAGEHNRIKCVICLFEGVASGAADGYARMAGKPAATLLHLGSGLSNASANLHNAKRAHSPMVNIVGDHATYHRRYDAPLTSDIEGLAGPVSSWVRTSKSADVVGDDAADAIAAANGTPGQIATLILPADTAWNPRGKLGKIQAVQRPKLADDRDILTAAKALKNKKRTLLLIGGSALTTKGIELAEAIAQKTQCIVRSPWSNTRIERGAGRVAIERVPYPIEAAIATYAVFEQVILVGPPSPVAFFAYPNFPSTLVPDGCFVHSVCGYDRDLVGTLGALADALGATKGEQNRRQLLRPEIPRGSITSEKIASLLGALLPEEAIVCDESLTTGRGFFPQTAGAPPHDWLQMTGGAIGMGMSLAVGAAIACPNRRVINLQADGGGMYTNQALWTQARERLDILTLIWANRSYATLRAELIKVGVTDYGSTAADMLSLDRPNLDWISLARGMGVAGEQATTMEEFERLFRAWLANRGPFLIEVLL